VPTKNIGAYLQPGQASLVLTESAPIVTREFLGHIDQVADIIGIAAPPLEIAAQAARTPALTGRRSGAASVIAAKAAKPALIGQRSKDPRL
jgi:hypothetical protein